MKSLIALLLLAGTWTAYSQEIVNSNVPRIETIYGLIFTGDTLQIQVESNGCTARESFMVEKLTDPQGNVAKLLIVRNHPDWCRAYLPAGVTVEFSKEDLGLDGEINVHIQNPFGYNPRLEN